MTLPVEKSTLSDAPQFSTKGVFQAFGSGKLILLGEHAVVYGKPAIAVSMDRGATAHLEILEDQNSPHQLSIVSDIGNEVPIHFYPERKKDQMSQAFFSVLDQFEIEEKVHLKVTLNLPIKSGMGSSAAIATAFSRACAQAVLTLRGGSTNLKGRSIIDTIEDAVTHFERVFHGHPSGIDQAAAYGRGAFLFQPDEVTIQPLSVEELPLVVCVADKPSSTLKEVSRVAELHANRPEFCATIDSLIELLVIEGVQALENSDYTKFGSLMNDNHGLLYTLGCSTPAIEHARNIALEHNATGAKVTGAGGGGCVIAMAPNASVQRDILKGWRSEGLTALTSNIFRPTNDIGCSS